LTREPLVSKEQLLSHANFASRANQALPLVWVLRHLSRKQYFDPALEKVLGCWVARAHGLGLSPASGTVEACRKDPCVIEYHEVICPKQIGKVTKPVIVKRTRMTVYPQQPGRSPVSKGVLGDQFRGKVIIKF
jgi:hypothetical protein